MVVTGAGTGFGAEIAVRAAQEGARVVGVHYRSSVAGAERTAERVRAEGAEAVLLQADIVEWAQVAAMADEAFEKLGGVDVLVNNVGDVARDQMSWRDITEESIDHVLAVDIKGTMACIHEFGQRMLEQGHGNIVNIGSTVIVRGSARAPQYAAAKYGLLGVNKSYAHAFAPTVRVNIFAPGFIETEATLGREDWKSGRGEQLKSLTPMGRIPGPGRLRRSRALPRHRRRDPHHRHLHGRRRRLQHGRRLSRRSEGLDMKAYVLTGFDQPPELRDVETPEPGPGEIRVSVHGTSVNPVDHLVRMGFFRAAQEYRFPAVFGRDVSGVVDAVGPGVTRYAVGDHVYGFVKRAHIGDGTFAEHVVVPEDMFVSPAPTTLPLAVAGSLGLSGITALECVEGVPSGPGDVVVVNGATGGLGTFAVQIAKARGAVVIATARSAAGADSCGRSAPTT